MKDEVTLPVSPSTLDYIFDQLKEAATKGNRVITIRKEGRPPSGVRRELFNRYNGVIRGIMQRGNTGHTHAELKEIYCKRFIGMEENAILLSNVAGQKVYTMREKAMHPNDLNDAEFEEFINHIKNDAYLRFGVTFTEGEDY